MAKESTKPQNKHADRMIVPQNSQKYLQTYLGIHGSQETDRFPSFLPAFFFFQIKTLDYVA